MSDQNPNRPWLRAAMQAGKPFHARRQPRWRVNALNLAVFGGIVALIAVASTSATWLPTWLHVLVAGPVLGLCFYTLFAFVVHEASHDMFVIGATPEATRRYSRLFGWLCAAPFGVHYIRHWEDGHRIHHIRPLEPDDPQRFNQATGGQMVSTVLKLVFVPLYAFFHRYGARRPKPASGSTRTSKRLLYFCIAFWLVTLPLVAFTLGPWTAVALWWGVQITSALNQIKGALEHGGALADDPDVLMRSRSTIPWWRAAILPWAATTYHFEHHLNPRVPWFALPAYHRRVRALVPEALRADVFNVRLISQLAGRIGAHGQSSTSRAISDGTPTRTGNP